MKKRRCSLVAMLLVVTMFVTGCMGGGNTDSDTVSAELPQFTNNAETVATDYDVIVVGSDPEGIAAALSAARNGMKTLLLSKDATPGACTP